MDTHTNQILFLDGTKGKFSISPNIEAKENILSWVKEKKFDKYVGNKYRMDRHTRKRNKLYSFTHPISNTEVILKVSTIDKQYNLLRRINLLASTFINDYNLRAFKGALLLKNLDIHCAKPIAYWTESNFIFIKKSYYMYEKIEADHSLFSFSQELLTLDKDSNKDVFFQLAQKTITIVQKIHAAGFRQGDPHPGNFLITPPSKKLSDINNHDVDNMDMFIIDLDKFSISKPLGSVLKRFFDLRCMRRCTLGHYDQYDMLKFYLGSDYSVTWKNVLFFWIHGGFNPYKWLKKPKRGQ